MTAAVYAGPEQLLRVRDITVGSGDASARMELGPWSTGLDGRTALGALGVLADDVLGYAVASSPARPADRWCVSTEIALDALGTLPGPGEAVRCTATVRRADAGGAYASGEVWDAVGRVIVLIRQRARWIPLAGLRDPLRAQPMFDVSGATYPALAGMRAEDGEILLDTTEIVANPAGLLHGGISLAATDLAATAALAAHLPALTVRSIHIAFPRATPIGARIEARAEFRHLGRATAVLDASTQALGETRTISRITAEIEP